MQDPSTAGAVKEDFDAADAVPAGASKQSAVR